MDKSQFQRHVVQLLRSTERTKDDRSPTQDIPTPVLRLLSRNGETWAGLESPPLQDGGPWLQKPPPQKLTIGPGFARELTLRARLNACALRRPSMTISNHPFYPRTFSSQVDLVCVKAVGLPLKACFIPSPDLNAATILRHVETSWLCIIREAIHLHSDGILPYCSRGSLHRRTAAPVAWAS
jgi:hypothetical protein